VAPREVKVAVESDVAAHHATGNDSEMLERRRKIEVQIVLDKAALPQYVLSKVRD
jgi:hypothetical protein